MVFAFTMLFNGGMIPNYLLMKDLGILNTRWVMLIPGAISVYNMIICRTFFATQLPRELREAAQVDGCSEFRYFISIALPLSKAVIAVIALYYAVAHWNQYFNAFLYLSDKNIFPLQLILRDILIANTVDASSIIDADMLVNLNLIETLKYSLILVACVPIWCVYPFVQKYFVQGVMIGAIKG
jgi:putative aldouronate transport system permease protein